MGMADVVGLAQELFDLAKCDVSVRAVLERERRSLAIGLVDGTKAFDITSGSKNGGSYTARVGFSVSERMNAIRIALAALETGIRPSRTGHVRFC